MHSIARAALFALAFFTAVSVGAQVSRPGVPAPANPSVTLTTADIMAQQAAAPAVSTTAETELKRLLRPTLNRVPNPNVLPDPPAPKVLQIPFGTVQPKVAQTAATNFLGAKTSDSGFIPPDSMGTVGPSQFIVAVNGRIRSFDKLSGTPDGILDVTTDIFFASTKTPIGPGVTGNQGASDPRIRYDRSTSRWYMVMIDVPVNGANFAPNRVMIAVSDTASISATTKWTFFYFTPGPNFVDYPMLGMDNNALYIGANIFSPAGAFVNTDAYVVRLSSIQGAGPGTVTIFSGLVSDTSCVAPGANGPYAPQGVDNATNPASEGYFIGVSFCNFGQLVMRRVINPGSATPTMSADILVNVPNFMDVGLQPHLGNVQGPNGRLDASDTRLISAQVRGGILYTAHSISVDSTGAGVCSDSGNFCLPANPASRNGVRWYELNALTTPTPGVAMSGTVFDPAATDPQTTNVRWFSYPGIQVNGQGHVAIGFTASGPMQYANAGFTGRLATDAAGVTDPPTLYTNTSAVYNVGSPSGNGIRWGDYSYTSVDPNDDQTMWTIQEYAQASSTPLGSWGVRVARLMAPPPATPSAYSISSIPVGTASTTFTLTGTSTNGSGFFNSPGNFGTPSHLTVQISGGVTVTGVTYVNPTTLTVTVSTVAASPGLKVVKVINPDGQFAQDAGLIFTVTGAASPYFTSPNSFVCAVGAPCNWTFTTGAGPAPSAIALTSSVPPLPVGVNYADPNLSGTFPSGSQGTYTLTMTASNGTLPNAVQTFQLIVTASCGGFTDVTGADIFCNQTEWLKNRGITLGCTATTYCPNDPVTRGAMALFMQRLGDVISPNSYSDNVLSTGSLNLDSRPSFCTTGNFPSANFPRVAWITWSFDGNAGAPLTARVWSQTTFDNYGASFITNEANLMRVTAQGTGWVGTSATVKVSIPAGSQPNFRLRTDREVNTTTSGNFITGRCNIGILFMSVNGGSSPYDAKPAPGEQVPN